jgi:hypothetical protein
MLFTLLLLVVSAKKNVSDYVNVLVGTGGEGYGIGSTPPGTSCLLADVFVGFSLLLTR